MSAHKAALELRHEQRFADLEAILSTPAGRRFVWRLIDSSTSAFGTSFTGEALSSAFAEGRRAIGVELMIEVQQAHRAAYLVMVREGLEALEELEQQREAEAKEP